MSSPPSSSAADPPPPLPPPDNPLPLPPAPPPVRKFPAPCWNQEETLALIHAYQDKWYSLRRRNLRTADWEAVADEVNRRCPNQSPPKSSAQCRHKMEKLRKRYRAEKQRISSLPLNNNFVGSRFFPSSSWVFFDLMDAMEVGSGSGSGSGGSTSIIAAANHISNGVNNNNNNNNNMNHANNVNVPKLLLKDKEYVNLQNLHDGGFIKEEKNMNLNMNMKGKDDLGKYFDEILMGMGKGSGVAKFKVKNHFNDNNNNNNNNNNNVRYFDEDSKYEGYDYDGNGSAFDYNKSGRNLNFVSGFNKRKFGGERFGEDDSSSHKMFLNGLGSSNKRRLGSGSGSRGKGRDGAAGEMVASIRMLGEEFVKMEKMKMEMMHDIERKRMEAEMKKSQMMLESQHIIVNAIVQGLKKQKKVKAMEME